MAIEGDVTTYGYLNKNLETTELQALYDKVVTHLMFQVAKRVQLLFYQNLHQLERITASTDQLMCSHFERPAASDLIQKEDKLVQQMFTDICNGARELLSNSVPGQASKFDSMVLNTLDERCGFPMTTHLIEAITFDFMIKSKAIK